MIDIHVGSIPLATRICSVIQISTICNFLVSPCDSSRALHPIVGTKFDCLVPTGGPTTPSSSSKGLPSWVVSSWSGSSFRILTLPSKMGRFWTFLCFFLVLFHGNIEGKNTTSQPMACGKRKLHLHAVLINSQSFRIIKSTQSSKLEDQPAGLLVQICHF